MEEGCHGHLARALCGTIEEAIADMGGASAVDNSNNASVAATAARPRKKTKVTAAVAAGTAVSPGSEVRGGGLQHRESH